MRARQRSRSADSVSSLSQHSRWLSMMLFGSILVLLNALIAWRMLNLPSSQPFAHLWYVTTANLPSRDIQLWIGINATLVSCYLLMRWYFLRPLLVMLRVLEQVASPPGNASLPSPMPGFSAGQLMREIAGLINLLQQQSSDRARLHHELEHARKVLGQCMLQQETVLNTTNREIIAQYQAVLGYAHYLEEHIARETMQSDLRYDFDEVCESSFNLKLIAGSLELLRQKRLPCYEPLALAMLMQQTIIALAPSLDRRSMQLTTAEVDESIHAFGDPAMLSHVFWMMLLGLIRYAEDGSILHMGCRYSDDRRRAVIHIMVSELAPGRLNPEERGAHFERQLKRSSPHLFAETIRIHGNLQLAELLLTRMDASLEIIPLSPYSCEIFLNLPAAH